MTPAVEELLDRAARTLSEAERAFAADLFRIAAREAYLAGLNAALALVGSVRGRVPKTHRGARSAYSEVVRERFPELVGSTTFLARGYKIKEAADYGPELALEALETRQHLDEAARFIDDIRSRLTA